MKERIFYYAFFILLIPLLYLGCSEDEDEAVQFALTTNVVPDNSGTVSPSSGTYENGEQVTLSAVPESGFEFLEWGGDASGNTNPLVLTITSDKEVTATFVEKDADGDGVCDNLDQCPDTPAGQAVDASGCATSEKDSDGDGVNDDLDLCPETPADETADASGCSDSQKDSDLDGITDDIDQCPGSPEEEDVDEVGCSPSQKDTDGDGVTDDQDRCPDTPAGADVDEFGCTLPTEYTFIPDDNFEQILINLGIDDILDDYVPTNAISSILQLDLASGAETGQANPLIISDYTGLEDFTALQQLTLTGMVLEGNNPKISALPALRILYISCSSLDGLDMASISLEELYIVGSIYLADCGGRITNLDLSLTSNLKFLTLSLLEIDDLDATLATAPMVEWLTIIDIQEADGPIRTLDVTGNNNLWHLEVVAFDEAGPDVIDLRNGANQLLKQVSLWYYNPNVNWEVCIEADDPAYVESVIFGAWGPLPTYTVTTDCGN